MLPTSRIVILSEARTEHKRGEGERRILVSHTSLCGQSVQETFVGQECKTKILRLRPRGP